MKLQKHLVQFGLCIDFPRLQRPDDLLQADALFLPLRGDSFQPAVFKKGVDDLFPIGLIPALLLRAAL